MTALKEIKKLDEAVLDAYSWPHDLPDDDILERLLAPNLEQASGTGLPEQLAKLRM